MVHSENRTPHWIDRRLTGLAGPDYDATISSGVPIEPKNSQYGEILDELWRVSMSVGIGIAIGVGIGAALLAATGDAWWIAVGAGVGVAIGEAKKRHR